MLEDDATALFETLLSGGSLTLPSELLPLSPRYGVRESGPVVTLLPGPGGQQATGLPPLPPPPPPPSSQATALEAASLSGFTWFDIAPNMGSPMFMPLPDDLAGLLAAEGGAGAVPPPPLPLVLQQPHQQHQQHPAMQFGGLLGTEQQQQEEVHQAGQLGSRGGSGRRGAGRGSRSAADVEEERRARNRATQARFREKQKAKQQAVHHEYSSIEADLEQARSEQQELNTEHAVLQTTLHFRDAALASLDSQSQQPGSGQGGRGGQALGAPPQPQQQQQQPAVAGAGAGAAPLAQLPPALGVSRMRHGWSGSELSSGLCLSKSVAEQMERMGSELPAYMAQLALPVSAHPDEAMAVAHAHLAPRPTKVPCPLLGSAGSAGSGSSGGGSSGLEQAGAVVAEGVAAWDADGGEEGGQPHPAHDQRHQGGSQGMEALMQERPDMVARAMSTSPEEFVAAWRENAGALREVLEAFDATKSEAQLERILHLLRDFSVLMGLVMRLRPECAQALFATSADAPPDTWGAVAARVMPTPAQLTALRQLWHLYMGRLTTLRAERAAALEAVQHAAQHSSASMPLALPTSSLSQVMSGYLALFDAAGRLSTLRDEEFVAMLQLLGRIGLVLSPVQKARIAALAWPNFPDIVQITRVLAQEDAAQGVEEQQGALVRPPQQAVQQQQQQQQGQHGQRQQHGQQHGQQQGQH